MLELANVPWYVWAGILTIDLLALVSIWRNFGHSTKARLLWSVIVAVLPVLGALAWFPLGRERRSSRRRAT